MSQRSRRPFRAAAPLLLAVAAVAVALSACASVLGIDEPEPREAGAGPIDASTGADATDGSATDSSAMDANGQTDGFPGQNDTGSDSGSDTGPASETCSGLCVAGPPSGWLGPFAHSITNGGVPQPTPPPCAAPYATTVHDYVRDLDAPAASCTCTCGLPTGIICSAPRLDLFSDGACNTPCGTPQTVSDSCTPLTTTGCGNKPRAKVLPSAAVGGSCSKDSTESVPAKSWKTSVRLCELSDPATTGTCSVGRVCKPTPKLPHVTQGLCIAATGTPDCPPEYPERQVVYGDATDNRACSTCTCADPTGATCSASSVTGYDNANCMGAQHALVQGGACDATGTTAKVIVAPIASGGLCAAVGGQPTGSATPINATTICCSK